MDNMKPRNMLVLKNDTHQIFFEANQMSDAVAFRKNNSAFKYKRIRSVLQMQPLTIQVGELMPY